MKSLLHVLAVVLTVLLFLIKPPRILAAVCYKRINLGHRYYDHENDIIKDNVILSLDSCNAPAYLPPKYKRDPETDVDNEQIGEY